MSCHRLDNCRALCSSEITGACVQCFKNCGSRSFSLSTDTADPSLGTGSVTKVGSIPGSGRPPPWRRKWQPTPVFLPGKSHGQRSLEGYSPRDHKELDATEHTCTYTSLTRDRSSTTCTHGSIGTILAHHKEYSCIKNSLIIQPHSQLRKAIQEKPTNA